jgi:hypothetical protein
MIQRGRQYRFEQRLVEELTRQLGEFRQGVGEALTRHGNQVNDRLAELANRIDER